MRESSARSWEEAVRWLMTQPDKRDLAEAAYFDQSPLRAAKRYAASTEWEAIRCLLPVQTGFALDVGAGNGIVSHALA